MNDDYQTREGIERELQNQDYTGNPNRNNKYKKISAHALDYNFTVVSLNLVHISNRAYSLEMKTLVVVKGCLKGNNRIGGSTGEGQDSGPPRKSQLAICFLRNTCTLCTDPHTRHREAIAPQARFVLPSVKHVDD